MTLDAALPYPLADKTEEQTTQVDIGGKLWSLTVRRQETDTLYLLTAIADPQQETMAQLAHQLRLRLGRLTLSVEGLQQELGDFLQHQHRKWIAREDLYLSQLNRLADGLEFMSLSEDELNLFYPVGQVDLVRLCTEAETLLSGLAETIGRSFTFRYAMGDYPVRGNPELLRKLLFQLAANSFEAKGDVSLMLRRQGSTALLYFSDNGGGIPAGQMTKLFSNELNPDSADTKTLGLGLSICRRIAVLYGGTLTLLPQPKGTKVVVSLPLMKKNTAGFLASSARDFESARMQALTELSDVLPYGVFERKFGE